MDILDKNWLTSEPIDFEYKSYLILAYEQRIKENFNSYILYPHFDDLLNKLRESKKFIDKKKELNEQKKSIEKIDTVNYKLIYKSDISDQRIEDIEEIAQFAYKKFHNCYLLGEKKYIEVYTGLKIFDLQLIKKNIDIVGLIILQIKDFIKVYSYELIKLVDETEIVHGIHLKLIEERENSASYINLLRTGDVSVFLVKSKMDIDENSLTTILKKKLLNFLSTNLE